MKSHVEEPEVIYKNTTFSITEAGACFFKILIEEEIPKTSGFPQYNDPYKWLSDHLHKSPEIVRKWTYTWRTSSGVMPTLDTFLYLICLTKTPRIFDFMRCLTSGKETMEYEKQMMYNQMADCVQELADNLREMGNDGQ